MTVFEVGAEGGLNPVQTLSALEEGQEAEGNSGADIHLTPDGRFLYASVRGDDSIAGYTVEADGQLTWLGRTDTETRPREFSVTADGRFLVVAGQVSGNVASYRIGDDGSLELLDTEEVGDDLLWVAIE